MPHKTPTKRKTHRKSPYRRPLSRLERKRWNDVADRLLAHCSEIFEMSADFDTAVRDTVAQGLAYLVHSAFDCRAIAHSYKDFETWSSYIDNSTAEWFRARGYVEWFAAGAATLFNTTPPRRLAERAKMIVVRKRAQRRKKNAT